MFHFFRSAAARTLTLTLMGVVVLGLLLGAVRLALPFADLFRSQIENVLSHSLGLRVQVSEFRVRLAGMVPRVTLEDVTLMDAQTGLPQLHLMELRLDLDLASSLLARAPRVESLTLVGAHLVVQRHDNGALSVAGLEGIKGNDPRIMTFFLANGHFLLIDSDIDWIDAASGSPPLHLADVQIRFDNTASHHRVGLRARLAEDPASHLHLAANLRGAAGDLQSWAGEVFLQWRGSDMEPVISRRLPPEVQVSSAVVNVRSWVQISHSRPVGAISRVSAEGLDIRRRDAHGASACMRVERLDGTLHWQREVSGWRLEVSDLFFEQAGRRSPVTDAGIRLAWGAEGQWTLTGGAAWLQLADLGAVLPLFADDFPALTALRGAEPRGELRDLRLRVARMGSQGLDWAIRGRLRDLDLQAEGRLPDVRGLDADFVATNKRGYAMLQSQALAFDLPWLFEHRSPLRFEYLSGAIFWNGGGEGGLRIETPALDLVNRDIRSRTRFAVTLPAGGGSPFLDLQTDFGDGNASAVRDYLPGGKLKARLERWLERAFIAGHVPWGTALFRGRLSDFPFRSNEGRLEVLFRAEDAVVNYSDEWPLLKSAAALVRFVDSRLDVAATGRLFDSEVTRAQVSIPDLFAAKALHIEGSALGPFPDLKRLLRETPLRRRLGRIATVFDTEGGSRVDVKMEVPLKRKQTPSSPVIEGALSWPRSAALRITGTGVTLTRLRGALSFTEHGLSRSHVEARLWDAPVDIGIEDRPGRAQEARSTRVTVAGKSQIKLLAERFPHRLWELTRGGADWELTVEIPNAAVDTSDVALDLRLSSDLRGVSVQLPAPVGKEASRKRALRLEGQLAIGRDFAMRGRYGDLHLNLSFVRGQDDTLRLARGALALGHKPPPLPQAEGLTLSGHIAVLDLPAWAEWLGQRPAATGDGLAVRSADLRIDRLLTPGVNCTDLRLDLSRTSNSWEANLEAKELAGYLSLPLLPRSQPIRIDLQRADLQALLADEQPAPPASNEQKGGTDPRRAPTWDLTVERLSWGEKDLGRLEMRTRASADGMELSYFELKSAPLMTIRGTGHWIVRGDHQETLIDLSAKGSDLGEFLRRMDYKSVLQEAPAEADAHLQWRGGPGQFSFADLSGNISAEVGQGRLLEVEPGVGRMLGILNLGALQRRLRLDFSDLFQRGYAFEKMVGHFTIDGGRAHIGDLVIDGPSAVIHISGSTDLVARRFDQVVTVTPSVGTGVALASAVAGGPLVGAAVLIADRIAGGAVDKLVSYQYDVTGSWSDPDIRRRGLTGDATSEQPFLPGHGRAGVQQPTRKRSLEASEERRNGHEAASKTGSEPRHKPAKNLFLPGH